jgi:hypothetical protein
MFVEPIFAVENQGIVVAIRSTTNVEGSECAAEVFSFRSNAA